MELKKLTDGTQKCGEASLSGCCSEAMKEAKKAWKQKKLRILYLAICFALCIGLAGCALLKSHLPHSRDFSRELGRCK